MSDNLTWGVVGVGVVTEAIKFLYGQATESLKRWREHKGADNPPNEIPTNNPVPDILEGNVQPLVIHLDAVGQLESEIKQVRTYLSNYADDAEDVTLDNSHLLEEVDALRRMLEAVYRQRLTFKGEQRFASGPIVEGGVSVEEVAGYVAGVRARAIQGGFVRGIVEARNVISGGEAVGVDIDTIG